MLGKPQPKPIPQAVLKARQDRTEAKAWKECQDAVWVRAGKRCERCGRYVEPYEKCDGWEPWLGEVNHIKPLSLGGARTDTNNCELVCKKCHTSGPSGAHAPTADRMVKR